MRLNARRATQQLVDALKPKWLFDQEWKKSKLWKEEEDFIEKFTQAEEIDVQMKKMKEEIE